MSLKQYYFEIGELIDKDGKTKEQIKSETDAIGRKFRKILEELGFDEEVGWYKSEKSDLNKGYFIFDGAKKEEVLDELNELFDLFGKRDGLISFENAHRIIEILCNMLPWIKDENRLEEMLYKSNNDIKRFIELLDEMNGLKIFEQNSYGKAKRKELGKIADMLQKLERFNVISESRDSLDFTNEIQSNTYKEIEINEIVYNFFLSRMNGIYFQDTIYVGKINSVCNESNKDFLAKQYLLVKIWCVKWIYIIDYMFELRKAEDFYNACELIDYHGIDPDYIEKFLQDVEHGSNELVKDYSKFPRLGIRMFSDYCKKIIKSETIKNETLKKMLEDRDLIKEFKDKSSCCYSCKSLVDKFSKHKAKGIDESLLRSIRIAAFKELEKLKGIIWDSNKMEKELEKEKDIVDSNLESVKEKYLNYCKTYGKKIELNEECLECIFDIKYNRTWGLLDYRPYAISLMQNSKEFQKYMKNKPEISI